MSRSRQFIRLVIQPSRISPTNQLNVNLLTVLDRRIILYFLIYIVCHILNVYCVQTIHNWRVMPLHSGLLHHHVPDNCIFHLYLQYRFPPDSPPFYLWETESPICTYNIEFPPSCPPFYLWETVSSICTYNIEIQLSFLPFYLWETEVSMPDPSCFYLN